MEENIVGKGENVSYQDFFLFLIMILKASFLLFRTQFGLLEPPFISGKQDK